eukprot:TRINITY_DN50780_c0_g1_i1.p1 TRINITY_DN50780_c0_g1~~TRINITY_DN50780_c0_g1_i1.p1  ORF type:complete len:507 (+),score=197.40 TRINITY_DN50780_c0_g1_i1:117-1523(+)
MAVVEQPQGLLTGMSTKAREQLAKLDAEEWDMLVDEVVDDLDLPCQTDIMAEDDNIDYDKVETVKDIVFINRSPDFHKMLQDIERVTAPNAVQKDTITKDDPEHSLVHTAMKCCVELQQEISKIHTFIRTKYKKYFAELEQFVVEPMQYAKCVKIVGNEFELEHCVRPLLSSGIPSTTVVKIIVTRSTCAPNADARKSELNRIKEACDEMLTLEEAKQFVLEYTQLRMNHLAPNVSAIVGTAVAAQIIGIVGGLDNLIKLPADQVMTLGRTKRNREHEKATMSMYHGSFLLNSDIVRSQEPDFRERALKMVANKVILAARVDGNRFAPDGGRGAFLRDKILRLIEGIKDGTIESSYRPGLNRKRPREAQDLAVLAAARDQLAQGKITGGPLGLQAQAVQASPAHRAPQLLHHPGAGPPPPPPPAGFPHGAGGKGQFFGGAPPGPPPPGAPGFPNIPPPQQAVGPPLVL